MLQAVKSAVSLASETHDYSRLQKIDLAVCKDTSIRLDLAKAGKKSYHCWIQNQFHTLLLTVTIALARFDHCAVKELCCAEHC